MHKRKTQPSSRSAKSRDLLSPSSRRYLRVLFAQAAERMGGKDEPQVKKFLIRVFQLSELFRAFHLAPQGAIGGKNGAADQLGVSRNAVYLWLDALELHPDDLRTASDFTDLLHRSGPLKRVIRKLAPKGRSARSGPAAG